MSFQHLGQQLSSPCIAPLLLSQLIPSAQTHTTTHAYNGRRRRFGQRRLIHPSPLYSLNSINFQTSPTPRQERRKMSAAAHGCFHFCPPPFKATHHLSLVTSQGALRGIAPHGAQGHYLGSPRQHWNEGRRCVSPAASSARLCGGMPRGHWAASQVACR